MSSAKTARSNKKLKTENRKSSILFILWTLSCPLLFAQVAPKEGLHDNTPRVFFIKGATIIPKPGEIIPSGEIVIRDGLIESVGKVAKVPRDAFEIDMTGKTIYPGFIESYLIREEEKSKNPDYARATAGGQEPNSKKKEKNVISHWNAKVHPERSVLIDFKPDEKEFESLRKLGFTTAHLVPASGIFRGKTALIHLGDWSPKSIITKEGPTQVIAFEFGGWKDRSYPNSLLGCIALIRQTFLDAEWYSNAWRTYRRFPEDNEQPEVDIALETVFQHLQSKQPFCFETKNEIDVLRAGKIAKEFNLNLWLLGSGYEYQRLKEIAELNPFVILPLNYPKKPNVETWESALQYTNEQLRHWDQAPDNSQRMRQAGINFSITSAKLKKRELFRTNLLRSVERGFSKDDALASLTTIPAYEFGIGDRLGTIENGKIANLVITDGDYFEKETQVLEVWIQGDRYPLIFEPEEDFRGKWVIRWEYDTRTRIDSLDISGKKTKLSGNFITDSIKIPLKSLSIQNNNSVSFLVKGDTLDIPGLIQFSGIVKGTYAEGKGQTPDGKTIHWFAKLKSAYEKPEKEKKKNKLETASDLTPRYPEGAFGLETLPEQPPLVLVKNATIWTCGLKGILHKSDLLVKKGKIWKIGKNLSISKKIEDAVIIDARGKHITPGLIDCHSHSAAASINEGTQSVTAEVRIEDVINSDDIAIYRELAGGLTIANILHGSANAIGGQNAVIKLRWGETPENLLFKKAPKGIKFALGENVKQSNWGDAFTTRYPQTRMGVEQIIRDAFSAAKDYQRKWDEYKGQKAQELKKIPPRRDLEMEALVEILNGDRWVHSHSYRQDEVLMLIRVAEDFGFRIGTFQHILEGYKIAEAIASHGAGASTFSDWWAYKIEVIDAIPYNGALMQKVGVVTSFNSDSGELARRLNTEAAKAVKYGGLSKEEALKFVTINPAIQLGIDKWVGSLEEGKDADFIIWSDNPLSSYTVCEQTWIDGKNYFNIVRDRQMRKEVAAERNRLIQKILTFEGEPKGEEMPMGESRPHLSHPNSCLEGVLE